MQIAAILPFAAVPILLAAALAVRFAGTSRILNIVDYSRVADPAALHRWAGNRLLLLPAVSAGLGFAGLEYPPLAIPLVIVFVMMVLGMAGWIAAGSGRFCDYNKTR